MLPRWRIGCGGAATGREHYLFVWIQALERAVNVDSLLGESGDDLLASRWVIVDLEADQQMANAGFGRAALFVDVVTNH